MNESDLFFAIPPWEATLAALHPGDTLAAERLLADLADADEEAVEDALASLTERDIRLDISRLHGGAEDGEASARLKTEEALAQAGRLPAGLAADDPLRVCLEEIAALPTPDAETETLAARAVQGDAAAQEALTSACLPWVAQMAMQNAGRGVLLLDLIQEGSLALWQAVLGYPGGGFAAFAERRMAQAMARAVLLQARENGAGQHLKTEMERYRAADHALLSRLGRNPTLAEIADEMKLPLADAETIGKMLREAQARPKNAPKPDAADAAEAEQPVESTAYFQSRQRVSELLACLDEVDARLLALRFGLDGEAPLEPAEAAKRLGMTPDEVQTRERAALQALRMQQKQ